MIKNFYLEGVDKAMNSAYTGMYVCMYVCMYVITALLVDNYTLLLHNNLNK